MSFKVGDRVIRKREDTYKNDGSQPQWDDPNFWKGVIVEQIAAKTFIILSDNGLKTQWSSNYFEHSTPLKELL